MKVVALVQARMGSTRLPEKVLRDIVGKPMIELLLARLSQSSELDEIVVTNTIPLSEEASACEKIRQISVAELLAESIRRISDADSVSSLFMD